MRALIAIGVLGAALFAGGCGGDSALDSFTATPVEAPPAAQDPSTPLDEFAARADEICNSNYFRMEAEDHASRAIGRRNGLSKDEQEASSWYATAAGMMRQYRELKALGDAPDRPQAMRNWVRTSRERARLNRDQGDNWLYGDGRDRSNGYAELQLAQYKANLISQSLPFHTCGHDPAHTWQPNLRQQRFHPRLVFVVGLTSKGAKMVHVGTPVYWYHHIAGRVTDLVRGGGFISAELRLRREYAPHAVGAKFELFRSRDDRHQNWYTIIPARDADPDKPKPIIFNIQ